jgi:Zinc finger, C3HC4 type (RING finger)
VRRASNTASTLGQRARKDRYLQPSRRPLVLVVARITPLRSHRSHYSAQSRPPQCGLIWSAPYAGAANPLTIQHNPLATLLLSHPPHYLFYHSLIYIDAVVLPCSHSFCRVCIEVYWRSRDKLFCPSCHTTDDSQTSVATAKEGLLKRCYTRCSAIDNVVWVVNEGEGGEEREVRR